MQNNVVVHYREGKILKGTTNDFSPAKPVFHLTESETRESGQVAVDDLKALFFVKSLEGNRTYDERPDAEQKGLGQRIRVTFKDGEVMTGYTNGYSASRKAFFVFPADANSNNIRVYVLSGSTTDVKLMPATASA